MKVFSEQIDIFNLKCRLNIELHAKRLPFLAEICLQTHLFGVAAFL